MNKTIFQLAYRQVKVHKSQYLFMCVFIFVMTLAFHTYIIGTQSYHQMHRVYNEKNYGSWYNAYYVQDYEGLAKDIGDFSNGEVHLMYVAGEQNQNRIGFGNEGFYDFCAITLEEGHFPSQHDEIVVSDHLSYQINDLVEVDILGLSQKMKVVGIVHNSQDIFCDMYIMPQDDFYEVYLYCDTFYSTDDENVVWTSDNAYGYNHDEVWVQYMVNVENFGAFVQGGIFLILSLFILTTTFIQKRVKEFALLRGIGMTTKQLFLMEMYEIALCGIFSILLATLLAPVLSYLIVYYISLSQECFIYIFSLPTYLFYTFVAFLSVLCFFIYPARKSSYQALSGAFDNAQFKYFDVRIRKLKYIYKWRIAWREWKNHKRMNLLFIILICLCSGTLLMNQMIKTYNDTTAVTDKYVLNCQETYYLEVEGDIDQLKQLEQFNFPETYTYSYQNTAYASSRRSSSSSPIIKMNDKFMKKAQIKGTYPQNENEVLVNDYTDIAIGDTIKIENYDFDVTGIVQSYTIEGDASNDYNSFDYQFINGDIFMKKEAFDKVFSSSYSMFCIWYDDFKERDQYVKMIEDSLQKKGLSINDHGEIELITYGNAHEEIPLPVDDKMMFVTMMMFFVSCYYLNKNYLINHQRDYMMMKIIGMTKREMLIKELEKGFYSFIIINVINIALILLEGAYLEISYIPVMEFLVMSFICLGICMFIYIVPLYVLWNDLINIGNGGE